MAIFEIYGQQKTLTQWDVGRRLIIQEACTHIHYANAAMTEAIVCEVTESEGVRSAPIPDEVLQVSGTLRVYAFLDGSEGYTKHIQTFFVKAKPKPADYVYTPTERVTLEAVVGRLDALEKREETDPTVPGWAKQVSKPSYTAAEVGAAPAGYGLGGGSANFSFAEIDNIRENGWYASETEGVTICGIFFKYVHMRVDAWDANSLRQTLYPILDGNVILMRECFGNTWGDWVDCSPSAFAPAGYGLGGKGAVVTDINDLMDTGVYTMAPNATGNPCPGNRGSVSVIATESEMKQTVSFPGKSNAILVRVRRLVYGETSYGKWEWVNPPMAFGAEYRTTERFISSPVYTMALQMGALPNAGTTCISVPATINGVVSIDGIVYEESSSGTHTIANQVGAHSGLSDLWINVATSTIYASTTSDLSTKKLTVILKYIK